MKTFKKTKIDGKWFYRGFELSKARSVCGMIHSGTKDGLVIRDTVQAGVIRKIDLHLKEGSENGVSPKESAQNLLKMVCSF